MALHGELKINGVVIAYWSAQRLDQLEDADQESLYYVVYEESVQDLSGAILWGDAWAIDAVVTHRYSDGAAVLAQKVLTLAEGGW